MDWIVHLGWTVCVDSILVGDPDSRYNGNDGKRHKARRKSVKRRSGPARPGLAVSVVTGARLNLGVSARVRTDAHIERRP